MASLKYIHNETVNIYSHLFGAVLFFLLPFRTYYLLGSSSFYSSPTVGDYVVFGTFFYGVAACFFLSAM